MQRESLIPEAERRQVSRISDGVNRDANLVAPAELPRPTILSRVGEFGAPVFVWGTWFAMLVANLAFTLHYGSAIVYFADDWDFTPGLWPETRTVYWLWEQVAEHRAFLGKTVWLVSLQLTDGNLHAPLFLSTLFLGCVALVLILAVRKLRGRTSYEDTFFPLLVLNLGCNYKYMFPCTVVHFLPAVFVVTLFAIVVRSQARLTPRAAVVAGACLVLLPWCSATGLPLVLILSVWMAYAAVREWRAAGASNKGGALLLGFFAVAAPLSVALYFVGLEPSDHHPPSPSLSATLQTSLKVVSMSLGPVANPYWDYAGLGVTLLSLITVTFVAVVWCRHPQERLRASGILLFMGAMLTLALCIGWGRAGLPWDTAFQPHYLAHMVPVLYTTYFAWELYAPAATARFVHFSLLAMCLLLFWPNTQLGAANSIVVRQRTVAFERDILAGKPAVLLGERHGRWVYVDVDIAEEHVAALVRKLHQAGIGRYRDVANDPTAFDKMSVPVEPVEVNGVDWKEGVARELGSDPYLVFDLKEPRFVYAIRLKCSYEDVAAPPSLRVYWTNQGQPFAQERSFLPRVKTGSEEQVITIWVWDTIDRIRVHPTIGSFAFRLTEIVLLVPQD